MNQKKVRQLKKLARSEKKKRVVIFAEYLTSVGKKRIVEKLKHFGKKWIAK